MADTLTGKKVAVVRLEGTLTTHADLPVYIGDPRPENVEKVRKLQAEGYFIVIVSGLTKTQHGVQQAFKYIADHQIPYDDLFCSFGLPTADRWIDDRAEKLSDGVASNPSVG